MSINCARHPVKISIGNCRKCGTPYCSECRVKAGDGVFCSHECAQDFKSFQGSMMDVSFKRGRGRFSIFGGLKTLIIAAILIAVIYFVTTGWLGTSDPAEMLAKLRAMFKAMF